MLRRFLAAVTLSALFAMPGSHASANSDSVIEYRQHLMRAIGGHMAAVAAIVKGRLPLTEHIAEHAELIENAAELVPAAFEEKVSDGLTDAQPEIWSRMDEFVELNAEMSKASAELAKAAEEGDMRDIAMAMQSLGKSCGSCHQPFRKPKEESYKQPR